MDSTSPPPAAMPLTFYNMPSNCSASFSTRLGTRPKRALSFPYPTQVVHSDIMQDVNTMASYFRKEFPELVYEIHQPTTWYQLYDYFDAFEIYVQGAYFLMQVLYRIVIDNSYIVPLLVAEIDNYASEWITFYQQVVISTNPSNDILLLLSPDEIADATNNERILLRRALENHRDLLFMGYEQSRSARFDVNQPQILSANQQPLCFAAVSQTLSSQVINLEQNPPAYSQQNLAQWPPSGHFAPQSYYSGFHAGPIKGSTLSSRPRLRRSSIEVHRSSQQTHTRRHVSSSGSLSHNRPTEEPTYVASGKGQSPQHTIESKNLMPMSPKNSQQSFRSRIDPFSEAVRSPKASISYGRSFPPQDARHYLASNKGRPPKSHQRLRSSGTNFAAQRRFEPEECPTNPMSRAEHFSGDAMNLTYSGSPLTGQLSEREGPNRRQFADHPGRLASSDPSFFYGAEVPFINDSNATFSLNGACQYAYGGDVQSRMDYEGSRTAFVNLLDQSSFESHLLKNIMSQCGQILSIVFWPLLSDTSERKGHAFVIFDMAASATEAIKRFNGYPVGNGETLAVNYPRKNRSRSNSNRARRHHHSFSYVKNVDNCTQAHGAADGHNIRNQPGTYHPHLYSGRQSRVQSPNRGPLTDGFQRQLLLGSGTADVDQLHPAGSAPEKVIINTKKDGGITHGIVPDFAFAKKENVPGNEILRTEVYEKQISQPALVTPRPLGKTKKKAYRKPRSNWQTPQTSPTRSRPEKSLGHVLDSVSHVIEQFNEVLEESLITKRTHKTHQGTKKKGKGKPVEPRIESIEELVSPTDTEATEHTTSKSTSTSISKRSSRNTSIASTSFTHLSETVTPKADCSEQQKTLSSNTTPTFSIPDHATEDLRVTKSNKPKAHASKGGEVPSTENASRITTKKLNDSRARGSQNFSKKPREQAPDSGTGSAADFQPCEANIKLNLDDEQQFPSLEPATSLSSLADGKRPIPTKVAYCLSPPGKEAVNRRNQSGQKSHISSLVAIPRVLQPTPKPKIEWNHEDGRSSPVDEDKQGSRSWPFVISFRENQA